MLLFHFNYQFFRGWENSLEGKPLIHFSTAPSTGIYKENCREIAQETHGWKLQGGLKLLQSVRSWKLEFLTSRLSQEGHTFSLQAVYLSTPFLSCFIFLFPSLLQTLSKSVLVSKTCFEAADFHWPSASLPLCLQGENIPTATKCWTHSSVSKSLVSSFLIVSVFH